MKTPISRLALLALPLALNGCLDRFDYHGADPKAYNEVIYPKTNKVEFNSIYQSFHLTPDGKNFVPESHVAFDAFTDRVYPSAVERLVIASPYPDDERAIYVTRQLRALGFKKKIMQYVVDEKLQPDEVVVQMDYNYVIGPDCPDWRKSSDLNYSNTNMSQMGCTSVTNLGRQVANPKHLIESDSLHVNPEAALDAAAIGAYRTGGAAASGSSSAASASGEAASTGEAAPAQ